MAQTVTTTSTAARRQGNCGATANITQPVPDGWKLSNTTETAPDSRTHDTWNADCVSDYGPEWGARAANADGGNNGDWEWSGAVGKARCIQVQHTADKLQCCLNKGQYNSYNNSVTCNPDWDATTTDCCDDVMTTYCNSAANFFSPVCETWLKNLGNIATKDTVALQVCPQYRFSTNPADLPKKNFCACYNATVPASLQSDPVLSSQALCLDAACNQVAVALQPAWKQPCDLNYVVCQNLGNQTKLVQSGISQQTIQNQCGVTIGTSSSGTTGVGAPTTSTTPAAAPSGGTGATGATGTYNFLGLQISTTEIIVSIVVCIVCLLLGIGIIVLIFSTSSTKAVPGGGRPLPPRPPMAMPSPYYR